MPKYAKLRFFLGSFLFLGLACNKEATDEDFSAQAERGKAIVTRPDIFGGGPATPGSALFVTALVRAGSQRCAGVLLEPSWVLTAAHCGDEVETIIIGSQDLSDIRGGEIHPIDTSSIFCHRDFEPSTLENDIALVRLSSSSRVTPARVFNNDNWETPSVNVILTGWGDGTNSRALQEVSVPRFDRVLCERLLNPIRVPETEFCTFSETRGALRGDSGGPSFIEDQSRQRFVVGVISGGKGRGFPNKHTRITATKYREWIRDVMNGRREMTGPC